MSRTSMSLPDFLASLFRENGILLEWSLERAEDWKVSGDESDEEGEPARMQNVNVKRYKDKPDITPSILLDAHDYREAHLDRPVVRLTVGDGTAYFISSDKGRIIDKQSCRHFIYESDR
jgi:hypothetical protein